MSLDNPYRPPVATTAGVPDDAPAPDIAPRPISVWLMVVAMALLSIAALYGESKLATDPALAAQRATAPMVFATVALIQTAKLALALTLLVGLWRRRPWARWLGLLYAVGLLIFCIMRPDHRLHGDDAERAGAELGQYVIIPALCVWWGWALAFSAKGRRYFGLQAVKALRQSPPERY